MPVTNETINSAICDIQTYLKFKQNSVIGNFASLKLENNTLVVDSSKSNIGRFIASLFSLGFYKRYRNENKEESLKIQTWLELRVNMLKSVNVDDLDENQQKMRETALKTFNATLFGRLPWPIPSCVNFFYWVLGVHNIKLERTAIAFDARGQKLLKTLDAMASMKTADSTAAQKAYVKTLKFAYVAKRDFETRVFNCNTVTEYTNRKKSIEKIEDEAVKNNFQEYIELWETRDEAFLNIAKSEGYFEKSLLFPDICKYLIPENAAKTRRDCMSEIQDVAHIVIREMVWEIIGDLSNPQVPVFINFAAKERQKDENQTFSKIWFSYLSQKIAAKLEEKFVEQNRSKDIFFEYQKMMASLIAFGLSWEIQNVIYDIFDPIVTTLKLARSNDCCFEVRKAFLAYAQSLEIEQKVYFDCMKEFLKDSATTIDSKLLESGQAKPKKHFEILVQGLDEVDVSSCGIKVSKMDDFTRRLSLSFGWQLVKDIKWFNTNVLPGILQGIKARDQRNLQEASAT